MIPSKCRMIDIGSGAGFPGIPLAIFRPEAYITLLESIHKKAIFLQTAIDTIGLVEYDRIVEKSLEAILIPTHRNYDIATVRALPKREQMMPHVLQNIITFGEDNSLCQARTI